MPSANGGQIGENGDAVIVAPLHGPAVAPGVEPIIHHAGAPTVAPIIDVGAPALAPGVEPIIDVGAPAVPLTGEPTIPVEGLLLVGKEGGRSSSKRARAASSLIGETIQVEVRPIIDDDDVIIRNEPSSSHNGVSSRNGRLSSSSSSLMYEIKVKMMDGVVWELQKVGR